MPSSASDGSAREGAGPHLVLASASPRRLDLIVRLTEDFTPVASPVEEAGSEHPSPRPFAPLPLPPAYAIPPDSDPRLWAWRKAADVSERYEGPAGHPVVVLAADTAVLAPGRLLGKPQDHDEALEMLRLLRGKAHYVVTGFVLVSPRPAGPYLVDEGAVVSRVVMRRASIAELKGYVATTEPMDKAGAYAVQGLGGRLVQRVDGCLLNVVGLPLCMVRQALLSAGVSLLPYASCGYCARCPDRADSC